jgi:hypothetical protein
MSRLHSDPVTCSVTEVGTGYISSKESRDREGEAGSKSRRERAGETRGGFDVVIGCRGPSFIGLGLGEGRESIETRECWGVGIGMEVVCMTSLGVSEWGSTISMIGALECEW